MANEDRNPMHYAKFLKIRANGKEYPVLEGATFRMHGMVRDGVNGSEVYGYTETAQSARVEADVPANYQTDFIEINNSRNVTIEVELDTGQIYLMSRAWNTEPVALAGGKYKLAFEAVEAVRIG